MCYRGQLTEKLASALRLSISEVWEALESLRLAWDKIGRVPCAEIDDLERELDLKTLEEIVCLLVETRQTEARDRQVA